MTAPKSNTDRLSLETRKFIPASPAEVFAAWTTPSELEKWWGPANVDCVAAEIDLRVGGRYRIANRLPDETILWIEGEYREIERPGLLVYTWSIEAGSPAPETVTVRFLPSGDGTELVVRHDRIESESVRDRHLQGWRGCLDGLVSYVSQQTA